MSLREKLGPASTEIQEWQPLPPEWQPEFSLEGPGGRARQLWEEIFTERKERLAPHFQLLFTGIGRAVALRGGEDIPQIREYPDGSIVPGYVDLERRFGSVPKALFLVASPARAGEIIALRALAREYKEQGVRAVIPVLTALHHERQDHRFHDDQGEVIHEATTLKDVVEILASGGYIDGALLVQPHSMRPTELGLRNGLPILPIDPFNFSYKQTSFERIPQSERFVMGPDKGRKDVARRAASLLQCPQASAEKRRARTKDGYPIIHIPEKVLEYIKENGCTVLAVDDEVRQGGTLFELAEALTDYADGLIVWVTKLIAAGRAVERLQHSLIKNIVTTDAVCPVTDVGPIKDKLRVISLEGEIRALVAYLQRNLVDPSNRNWLVSPKETGSQLQLDLRVEKYE